MVTFKRTIRFYGRSPDQPKAPGLPPCSEREPYSDGFPCQATRVVDLVLEVEFAGLLLPTALYSLPGFDDEAQVRKMVATVTPNQTWAENNTVVQLKVYHNWFNDPDLTLAELQQFGWVVTADHVCDPAITTKSELPDSHRGRVYSKTDAQ